MEIKIDKNPRNVKRYQSEIWAKYIMNVLLSIKILAQGSDKRGSDQKSGIQLLSIKVNMVQMFYYQINPWTEPEFIYIHTLEWMIHCMKSY